MTKPIDLPVAPLDFAKRLLAWFDLHGRHDLPWQKHITPYRVWVSEIMLQQTQVATVIPYYQRFMARFPDIQSLARAPQDEVLALWTGLGYYARARNLHKAAQQVMTNHQGRFPTTLADLTELAGIGRSTAGAILSIACGARGVILDGNVKRVLTRFMNWDAPPSASFDQQLWQLAERLTPEKRNADYTQAIMDLGATLCKRGQPACARCPFVDACLGHQQGRAAALPTGKKRKALPEKSTFMLLLENAQGELLLTQRPPVGLWGGLWCPPELGSLDELPDLLQKFGLEGATPTRLPTFRHTFSHFHLDITPLLLTVASARQVADSSHQWVLPKNSLRLGLAAPVKKLLHNKRLAHPLIPEESP